MPYYHNIERSKFHSGYVGWDCNGERYKITRNRPSGKTRSKISWWVYPQTPGGIPCFYAGTLALVSRRLQARSSISAIKAVEKV